MSELPPEAAPGLWQWGRAEPSDRLVVLPQSGLQELVRQVVSGDDPNNLGQGGKDPSYLHSQAHWATT